MTKRKRVFLSYSFHDKDKVDLISQKLLESGIEVYQDRSSVITGTRNLKQNIQSLIESSEIILVVLSKNFLSSEWANYELKTFLDESHKRKITVIPILIEKSKIPSDLSDYEVINLSKNFERGLEKIIQKLKVIPEITFDKFSPKEFENLIIHLLREYGFKNIQHQNFKKDVGVDIKAEFENKSPFGLTTTQHWIVEVKFYKQERFSISSIQKIIEYKRQLLPADLKLLLVTNSLLTSVVQDYLKNYQKVENTQIEVIDGLQLKQLISNRKRMLDKYFRV